MTGTLPLRERDLRRARDASEDQACAARTDAEGLTSEIIRFEMPELSGS
jgi:hypothetical protein